MYLKSLELSGFKSFAKKEQLTFKSAVTGIVGPNGSGKSNVAESFRFVLGEQSMKSLRVKRGEDLIWNGSEKEARANRAVVKAVFDNLPHRQAGTKRIFSSIDFDEVSIERRVNRDGTNEYLINGSEVRLKDVLELLAQANIGSSGHHIISQGEADRILSANIKERRAMIEDALGLKVYQYKREESVRKLLKTEENMKQVELLRREIAPHLRFLKRQVEKIGKAIEVKEKLAELYKEYLKRESLYISGMKNTLEKERKPLIEKKKHLEEEMAKAREVLSLSNGKDVKSEKLLKVEEEIYEARKLKEGNERELGKLEGEIFANSRIIESEKNNSEAKETHIPLQYVEDLVREIMELLDVTQIKNKLWSFIEKNRGAAVVSIAKDLELKNEELLVRKKEIEEKIKTETEKLSELDRNYKDIKKEIETEKDSERSAEREIFRISSDEAKIEGELNLLKSKEEMLRLEGEDFEREAKEAIVLMGNMISGFGSPSSEDPDFYVLKEDRRFQEERRREIEKMKIRLEELGSAGGQEVLKEFKDAEERDRFLEKELLDLKISSEALQKIIDDLNTKLEVEFKEGVRKINDSFHNFFSLMFGGGAASLEVIEQKVKARKMEDDLDESSSIENYDVSKEESGIDINVSLPKKRVKGLQMLSGGERALTSIALLFAISQVNPPPFIILDETDAALDEANSKKYGDMIEQLSKYSQLILITHNRETMSRAGVIYGVTMGQSGVSKLLSIEFDEAVSVAK